MNNHLVYSLISTDDRTPQSRAARTNALRMLSLDATALDPLLITVLVDMLEEADRMEYAILVLLKCRYTSDWPAHAVTKIGELSLRKGYPYGGACTVLLVNLCKAGFPKTPEIRNILYENWIQTQDEKTRALILQLLSPWYCYPRLLETKIKIADDFWKVVFLA